MDRKKLFFVSIKKNIRIQEFIDSDNTKEYANNNNLNFDSFLKGFLTEQEKEILSSLDNNRVFDLMTETNYFLFGTGIGIDLWFLETSLSPFLMYHDTSVSLRSCKNVNMSSRWEAIPYLPGGLFGDFDIFKSRGGIFTPTDCSFYPANIVTLDKQHYSGLAFGTRGQLSVVFLQTENWRISFEGSSIGVHKIWDSNFHQINWYLS